MGEAMEGGEGCLRGVTPKSFQQRSNCEAQLPRSLPDIGETMSPVVVRPRWPAIH